MNRPELSFSVVGRSLARVAINAARASVLAPVVGRGRRVQAGVHGDAPGCVNSAGILREAEVVSNSRNRIHQTWSIDCSRSLCKGSRRLFSNELRLLRGNEL